MYDMSPEMTELIKGPHTIATRAEVIDSNFVTIATLQPIQGNISVDISNDIHRICNVTLADPDGALNPKSASDILHPIASNRLQLYRGVVHVDGSEELLSQGIFEIFDADVNDTGESLEISIKGFDLSKRIQRARLLTNYTVDIGTNYGIAIRELINQQVPGMSFDFDEVDALTPALVFGSSGGQGGGDPLKYAKDMSESIAHDLYANVQAVMVLRPTPNPADDPVVWTYDEGDKSTLLYLSKNISKEETYNHVIASGENTSMDEPVRAEAFDDDPDSPTYVFGPFGNVPFFFRSEYIATESQALAVAQSELRKRVRAIEKMQVTTVVNPAHEAGDVIHVRRPRANIDKNYVLEKFNINFSSSQAMNMTVREVRE